MIVLSKNGSGRAALWEFRFALPFSHKEPILLWVVLGSLMS